MTSVFINCPLHSATRKKLRILQKLNAHLKFAETSKGSGECGFMIAGYIWGEPLDISPIFTLPKDFEYIEQLNEELRLETDSNNCLLISEMSAISDGIATKCSTQLDIFVGNNGYVGGSSTNFVLPVGIRKPDAWWTRTLIHQAQVVGNQQVGAPDFAIEVRSPTETLMHQRRKGGMWVQNGVQFVIMVDYIGRSTYSYALTASGLLPAINGANVVAAPNWGNVTEERTPWPAPPAPDAFGRILGPALVVAVPAATHLGAFNLNHALFICS